MEARVCEHVSGRCVGVRASVRERGRVDAQAWGRATVQVLKHGGTCIGALARVGTLAHWRSGLCVVHSQHEATP
jgi:hypothetical protein